MGVRQNAGSPVNSQFKPSKQTTNRKVHVFIPPKRHWSPESLKGRKMVFVYLLFLPVGFMVFFKQALSPLTGLPKDKEALTLVFVFCSEKKRVTKIQNQELPPTVPDACNVPNQWPEHLPKLLRHWCKPTSLTLGAKKHQEIRQEGIAANPFVVGSFENIPSIPSHPASPPELGLPGGFLWGIPCSWMSGVCIHHTID